MNDNMTATAQQHTPEPDAFCAAARSLEQRAESRWKHAARMSNLLLSLVLAASAVLAVPTGLVFINEWDWPLWLSFPIAFALHAFLAFFVHWAISFRKVGKIGACIAFGLGAIILVIGFFIVAVLRANSMGQAGHTAQLAWAAALIYWLVECAVPIGLGVAYENASENSADERARLIRAREFTRMIETAGDDADGTWSDAEARLEHENKDFALQAVREPDKIKPLQLKANEQKCEWLHALWETHPGKRFHELKGVHKNIPTQKPIPSGLLPSRSAALSNFNAPPLE